MQINKIKTGNYKGLSTRKAYLGVVRLTIILAIVSMSTCFSPEPAPLPQAASTPHPTAILYPTSTSQPTTTPSLLSIFDNVYYVSTSGNDANLGTQAQPWRTISKATSSLKSGQTAFVLAGIYNEQVNISASGITLQASGKVITKRILVSGSSNTVRGFTVTDPSSDPGIWTEGDHNLIEGNEIYHTKQDGIWFFGSYNTYRGNYIHDILDINSTSNTHVDCFQTWGWNWDTTHILFEKNLCINNRVADSHNAIATMEKETAAVISDITFRNNIFIIYRPAWAGFGLKDVSNITIENNTIVNMSQDGNNVVAYIVGISNISFINNLFINWGSTKTYQPYIGTGGETNVNIHNNDIYNYNGIAPNGVVLLGDLWMVDPKIVSISDLNFHLQPDSPLIDAGYNLGASVPTDFDGVTRPRGAGHDIGAYEFPAP